MNTSPLSPRPVSRSISRRKFMQRTAAGVGGTMLAAPFIARAKDANENVNLGIIGCGGKGAENLKRVTADNNVNIVALCDVDANTLGKAAEKFTEAKKYRDFRKLLEQKDIDAVVVTTPDHTHAVAAMAAVKLGKHVYCEKPLTHDLWEARQLMLAARERKVATQMGNAGHSSEGTHRCVEWIQAGVIGAVREVHSWSNRPIWPQGIDRPTGEDPVPAHLDWDLWLGPAPWRPFKDMNPESKRAYYHPFTWRGWWDFGTGALGDMGCHIFDMPFWALKLGAPTSVEAECSGVNTESAPKWSEVKYQFPARGALPPVTLTWHDGGRTPSRELCELSEGQKMFQSGSLFIGEKGKILVEHGGGPRLTPDSKMKDFAPPAPTIPKSIGHHAEWIDACKTGKPTGTNWDYAAPLTEVVLLGNLALRLGQKIEWDSKNLKVKNVPGAERFVRREYRKGWSL